MIDDKAIADKLQTVSGFKILLNFSHFFDKKEHRHTKTNKKLYVMHFVLLK
jgi:hypothetical protein